ncbi:MAG: flavin reductase family protein [Verrucomicrobia bacterium]|nr:flavin reductase family protein [Verrucomicrobiota bacterium]MCF7709041.1 flavin reductase family protein [Verrucomicrobiota bacterium]
MKTSIGAKTFVFPTPVFVVGAYDINGRPNIMTAAWGGICCSTPPCVAVSMRKATYTFDCIVRNKAFTVSLLSAEQAAVADYAGTVSGHSVDKFAGAGLTAQKSELVNAPIPAEFPVTLECELFKTVEIGLHTQFIGKIIDIKVLEEVLDERGRVNIDKLKPFAYDPESASYYATGAKFGKAFSIGASISKKNE